MQRTLRLGVILMTIMLTMVLGIMVLKNIPTDYVVYMPGPAEDVGPMVKAEAAGKDEGKFLLTAVYQSYPSLFGLLRLQLHPYAEFHKREEVFNEGETEEQYSSRQQINMLSSQSNAIIAVYERMGIAYRYKTEGLYVRSVLEGYPAASVFQAWDRIESVDGLKLESYEELVEYLSDKKAGDMVNITYIRSNARYTSEIELKELPASGDAEDRDAGAPSVGVGVSLLVMRSVEAEDERYRVSISAGDIGGPSAGLMFALEIYNRFDPRDITKGYIVAGTGEISPNGRVGVIGGIRHKVIGADAQGADIFFAPADYHDVERGISIPNYSEAVRTAQEIGSDMRIVEVSTLDDALRYLEQLPPKSAAPEENGKAA